ncbi:hypothetical protein [Hyphococcus sp.]|uniref:hypothetical protein n=1 Tax=Hyphococcus sp. TaxID=2038636 RepID=UPI003D0C53E2
MGLRTFSVMGEALNFGGRRMETIARVAWLPLILSMLATMAAVFAMLSVIAGRLITFSDVPSFLNAQSLAVSRAATGFEKDPGAMWTITIASIAAQTLLTASFMAPLIRYAGLGEKPAPGFIRAPFGPDQLRYVVASLFGLFFVGVMVFGPLAAASFYTLKYVAEALGQTLATFPNPESLHTIEITKASDQIAAAGRDWIYNRAIPLSGALPAGLLFWAILFFHFAPKNRPNAHPVGKAALRALTTFFVAAALMLTAYLFFAEFVLTEFRGNTTFLGLLSAVGAQFTALDFSGVINALDFLLKSPSGRLIFFSIAAFFVLNYISLRLFPYPGVAVCRKSLALGNTLAVSRGWDILRLWAIVTIISLLLVLIQVVVLNQFLLGYILPKVIAILYQATTVSTKLVNSGEAAEWVRPLFVWIWNLTKIVINIVWSFFSFGVVAGLYGRLYRESEKAR